MKDDGTAAGNIIDNADEASVLSNDTDPSFSSHLSSLTRTHSEMPEYTLPTDRLEALVGWGGAVHSAAYVVRPSTVSQLKDAFASANKSGRKITLRGAGRSYGDASLGRENMVIDLTRMNRILMWDPEHGIITCEPGVTIKQLWEYAIEDGWWLPVVPGTMFPTLGGVLAMNIHGKNNFLRQARLVSMFSRSIFSLLREKNCMLNESVTPISSIPSSAVLECSVVLLRSR